MKKDSIIWVSITKFGIEGARVKLTKDSVFFINKLYAEAFNGDYNFFSSLLGFKVDFGIIQSFILAKDFDNYDTKGYKIENNNDLLISSSTLNGTCEAYQFGKDLMLKQLGQVQMGEPKTQIKLKTISGDIRLDLE